VVSNPLHRDATPRQVAAPGPAAAARAAELGTWSLAEPAAGGGVIFTPPLCGFYGEPRRKCTGGAWK
jgi:hypothetical protein